MFLDLVVRDTIEKQTAALTQKAAGILEKGFASMGERAGKEFTASFRKAADGVGKDLSGTLEKSVSGVGEAAAGTVEKVVSGAGKAVTETVEKSVSEAGKAASDSVEKVVSDVGTKAADTIQKAMNGGYNKALENAQARVAALEEQFDNLGAKMDAVRQEAQEMVQGFRDPENALEGYLGGDTAFKALAAQQEVVLEKLRQAEDKLRAEKEKAAAKAAAQQEREAQRAAAAQERAAEKTKAAVEKTADAQENAAQRAANAYADILENIPVPSVDTFGEKILSRLREISEASLEAFNNWNLGDQAQEVDLLERKLESTYAAIDRTKEHIKQLETALSEVGEDSEAGQAIAGDLQKASDKLITLEQRALSTEKKLDKLTDGKTFSSWGEVAANCLKNVANGFQNTGKAAEKAEQQAKKSKKSWDSFAKNLKSGVGKAFGSLGKSMLGFSQNADKGSAGVRSFSARLRNIVSGALIFNGLSSALRGMTSRLGEAVTGTAQMKTALANLQGAAATAAAPLVSALTPALSAIANAAATAFSYLAKLISLLTGKSVGAMQSAAKSMEGYGSSAGGAAKKVKDLEKANNSLGLDELNVIDPQDDPDSGSGGGGGGAEDISPDFSFEGKSPFLDSVLEAIRAGDYTQVGVLFAEKLNGIVEKINWAPIDKTLTRWANHLADGLNGFVDTLDWKKLGNRLVGGVNTGLHAVDAFFQRFNWRNLGKGLADGLNGAVSGLNAAALGRVLTDKLRAAVEMLYGFVTTFEWGALGSKIAEMIDAAFGNIDWATAGQGVSGLVTGLLETIGRVIVETDWGKIGQDFALMLASIDWNGIVEGIAYALGAAFGGLVALLGGLLGDAWNSLSEYLTEQFSGVGKNGIEGLLEGMWNILCDLSTWLYEHLIEPLVTGVKDALGIHSPSTVFAEIGEFLVLGLFNGLFGAWGLITGFFSESLGAIIEKVSAAWENIKTATRTVWNTISGFVGGVWDGIRTKCGAVWDSVKEKTLGVWTALKSGIKSRINDIIRVMNGLISGAADMVNRMIDLLNGFSIDVPTWAQGVVGTDHFGFNIPPVSAPQIPMLAQGGYVGPNQPQLAIIGDNRREGEIVAPESKIAEAVAAGMAAGGGSGAGNGELIDLLVQILEAILQIVDKDTVLQLDGETVGRAVQRWMQNRGASVGGTFAEVY